MLMDLVHTKKPHFVFLMETLLAEEKMDHIRQRLGYEGSFVVGSLGHSGGLSMFWKEKIWAQVIGSSRNHIDIEVSMQDMGVWRLTRYYGFPEKYRRRDAWHMLWTLSPKSPIPWCCIGYYNDLLFQKEKIGHLCHHVDLLQRFKEATDASGLQDLGMIEYPFTWEKSKGTTD